MERLLQKGGLVTKTVSTRYCMLLVYVFLNDTVCNVSGPNFSSLMDFNELYNNPANICLLNGCEKQ